MKSFLYACLHIHVFRIKKKSEEDLENEVETISSATFHASTAIFFFYIWMSDLHEFVEDKTPFTSGLALTLVHNWKAMSAFRLSQRGHCLLFF